MFKSGSTRRRACSRLILEDELGRCLCFLDVDPAGYPELARQWAGRLLCELPLSLDDSQALLCALDALASGEPRGAERLLALLERYGLSRAAQVLSAWRGSAPGEVS
jgi:hypothetical protein